MKLPLILLLATGAAACGAAQSRDSTKTANHDSNDEGIFEEEFSVENLSELPHFISKSGLSYQPSLTFASSKTFQTVYVKEIDGYRLSPALAIVPDEDKHELLLQSTLVFNLKDENPEPKAFLFVKRKPSDVLNEPNERIYFRSAEGWSVAVGSFRRDSADSHADYFKNNPGLCEGDYAGVCTLKIKARADMKNLVDFPVPLSPQRFLPRVDASVMIEIKHEGKSASVQWAEKNY